MKFVTVVCTVVEKEQTDLTYNSKATVSMLFSLSVPILFQFTLIYLNLLSF